MDIELKQKSKYLAKELGITEMFAELLCVRGYDTVEKAQEYLHPDVNKISDPFLLTGMQEAVDRIQLALKEKEKIVIYGDYDCDGLCATSILYDYFRCLGADVSYYIPNRFDNGYGLSIQALEYIAETYFPDLIITVDTGVTAIEEAEYLAEDLAIDLIITDHHNVPETLPNAIVVDPKLDKDSYCYDICGAGVAFKLVQALAGLETALLYVDLAGLASVADIVPLVNENRIIASLGIARMNGVGVRKGIKILKDSLQIQAVNAHNIGFNIAPPINAVGRLGDASDVVNLFCSTDKYEIDYLVEKVNIVNNLRRSIGEEVYLQAIEQLKECDLALHKIIVLYQKDWNIGVLGLVAGRIAKEYSRPTLVLSGEGVIGGSGRSPEGINLYECIKSAKDYLVSFGGHSRAAGLKVEFTNLFRARDKMDEYLNNTYSAQNFMLEPRYDLEIKPVDLSPKFAEEVHLLEPTGCANPQAIFKFSSDDCKLSLISPKQYIKGKFNSIIDVLAFGIPYVIDGLSIGLKYNFYADFACEIFRNNTSYRLKINDVMSVGGNFGGFSECSYNKYLHSNIYPEQPCEFNQIKFDEAKKCFYDDDFCTLFIAFSNATVAKFGVGEEKRVKSVEYGKVTKMPANSIVIAPDFDIRAYKRIILLDTPLAKGYISYLKKQSNAEIFVVTDNYPFREEVANYNLNSDAIIATFDKIKRFVLSGGEATSPLDLANKLALNDKGEFLSHFYVLYESGALKIEQNFVIYPKVLQDLNKSILYRRLHALVR